MIPRFLRRLATFAEFVGRPVHGDPRTGRVYRIGVSAAWDLACCHHPTPAEEAESRAMVAQVIEDVRRVHAERCMGHNRGGQRRCCDRAGEYNGYGSDGPLVFHCPEGCSCHD